MARHVDLVVEDVQELLRKNGKDLVTLNWPEFYKLTGRERMKDEFTLDLREHLKRASILIAYGNAIVLIAKDFRFAPLK
jgi:hypothetical protein